MRWASVILRAIFVIAGLGGLLIVACLWALYSSPVLMLHSR
jgi:hypothetical protein